MTIRHHLMTAGAMIALAADDALSGGAGAAMPPGSQTQVEGAAASAAASGAAATGQTAPAPAAPAPKAPRKPRETKAKAKADAPAKSATAGDLAAALAAPQPGDPEAPAVHLSDADRAAQLFVACKLPHGLNLENGIILNGSNDDSAKRAGGFGITVVDGAAFNDWLGRHKDMLAVKRGLIFAGEDAAKVVAQAREYRELRSGFEQLTARDMPAGLEEETTSKAAREAERALGR